MATFASLWCGAACGQEIDRAEDQGVGGEGGSPGQQNGDGGGAGGTMGLQEACAAACERLVQCGYPAGVNEDPNCVGDCTSEVTAEEANCLAAFDCTPEGFFGCLRPPTEECTAMCSHIYDACNSSLQHPQTGVEMTEEECIYACKYDAFDEREECLTGVACESIGSCSGG